MLTLETVATILQAQKISAEKALSKRGRERDKEKIGEDEVTMNHKSCSDFHIIKWCCYAEKFIFD
jgi:hypothetical protein